MEQDQEAKGAEEAGVEGSGWANGFFLTIP